MNTKLLFLIPVVVFHLAAGTVRAQFVGGQSATLAAYGRQEVSAVRSESSEDFRLKRYVIRRVLEKYNSPLLDSTDTFISMCQENDYDCYFLPAIAGLESYYGTMIYPNSYNAFGWGRGLIMFESWDEGIETVGTALQKNYIDKGAVTIEQIGRKYCEGDTWAGKVRSIMRTFEKEEAKMRLFFSLNTVEL